METVLSGQDTTFSKVETLIEQGAYRDAFDKGRVIWDKAIASLSQTESRALAKLFDRLGAARSSDFITLRSYRQRPDCPERALHASYYFLHKKGPDFVWQLSRQFLTRDDLNDEQTADWLALQAIVSSQLRDFDVALEKYQASQEAFESNWNRGLYGSLLIDQEKFNEASDWYQQEYLKTPSEISLLRLARALSLDSKQEQAIAILKTESSKYQSVRPWYQLAQLSKDIHAVDDIEYAISQIHQLAVRNTDKSLTQQLTAFKAHIEVTRQNYRMAKKYLEQLDDYYSKVLLENIENTSEDKTVRLEVPYIKQKFLTCAPASMASILQYHGSDFRQEEIAADICFDGTPDYLQHQWLNQHKIPFREFDLTWPIAQCLIDAGLPFTLVTRSGRESHMQVVSGYNQRTGILYVMDPSSVTVCEYLAKELCEYNASVGPRCMVFGPSSKLEKIENIELPSETAYQINQQFQSALRVHDVDGARSLLNKLIKNFSNHRLTLFANRSWAIYLQDEYAIKCSTEKLLERFPEEIWIIQSLFQSFSQLGSRKEGLEYLKQKFEAYHYHELLEALVYETYDDQNFETQTLALLPRLHRAALYSAESNWLLGHIYWQKGNRDAAVRCYRWALTLNDTDERFSESFFNSSLLLGNEQSALKFLHQRWRRYSRKNSGPALSLFNAFSKLDEEHKGLSVLKKALEELPDDENLISFYLRKLLHLGEMREFKKLFKSLSQRLDKKSSELLKADYFYLNNKQMKSAAIYKSLLKKYPTDRFIYSRYFQILDAFGRQDVIELTLKNLNDKYHKALFANWLAVDWSKDTTLRKQLLEYLVEEHPYDINAITQYADLLIESSEYEQAQALLRSSIGNKSYYSIACSMLSKVALCLDRIDDAQDYAWKAITDNIDSDQAFEMLISSHLGAELRQEALLQVKRLSEQRTSNGNFLWNLWHYSRGWVSSDTLLDWCEQWLIQYPKSWYPYVLLAKQWLALGNTDKALHFLKQAENKFPLLPRVYLELAELYDLIGDYSLSIASFERTLTLNPSWGYAARRCSEVLQKSGELEKAISILEKSSRYAPEDGIILGLLADLYLRLNQKHKAIELLKQAVELEINYPWAWNQLEILSQQQEDSELAESMIKKLVETKPHVADCWIIYSRFKDTVQDKREVLEKGLELCTKSVSLHKELIHCYLSQYEYGAALLQLKHPCWNNNPPVTILFLEAEVFAKQGRYGEAIENLKSLLEKFPFYIEGWQKLHEWYVLLSEYSGACTVAKKLIELSPNDANQLSVCAETLFQYGGSDDKTLASSWLSKAFNIEPSDMHVSLSWLDFLLSEQRLSDAEKAEQIAARFINDPLLIVRKIHRLVLSQQVSELSQLANSLIEFNHDNPWIYHSAYDLYTDKSYRSEFLQALRNRMEQDNCCRAIATVWARLVRTNNNGLSQLRLFLDENEMSDVWSAVVQEYFNAFIEVNKLPPKGFTRTHREKIESDVYLFGSYGYLLCNRGSFDEAIKWYQERARNEGFPAYIWYHYRWALGAKGRWDEARKAIASALSSPPDNCFSNICLWSAYFKIKYFEPLEQADVINISVDELTEVEKYIFALVKAVWFLKDKPLELQSDEVFKQLRYCQSIYHGVHGSREAKDAKADVKRYLKAKIESSSWWLTMRCRFKLHNHF